MGNALTYLYGHCCKPSAQESGSFGHHGVSTVGVSALARDLFNFEVTSQVPEGLSRHAVSSKKAQANWYKKLAEAWKQAKPPPRTPDEATRLVILTLKGHKKADVEGLLTFYGLPLASALDQTPELLPPSRPEGVKYELQTLPVDAKAVADGDTVTVYVNTVDKREAANLPKEVKLAAVQRSKARAVKDYVKADALQKKIVDAGYRVLTGPNNEDILARKYRIRLRGIDAPESSMPFGKEAKEELLKLVQGKCLRVLIYGEDRYGRCVGDIYCNNTFVQESMLKKGLAWHYLAYDKRPELASVVGESRSSSTSWTVGFIEPPKAMGVAKEQARTEIACIELTAIEAEKQSRTDFSFICVIDVTQWDEKVQLQLMTISNSLPAPVSEGSNDAKYSVQLRIPRTREDFRMFCL
ncbi:hypothetical protein IFM89_021237 [Coptis chinensis]|uniref:TNase-like domain-containing protein n=1 Tax=Coptis chinensis TaxID=261450 RepID=A0A835HEN5_9MAGN|nr:hypothetical protein IFM89_021237 [Coptis chinensis]